MFPETRGRSLEEIDELFEEGVAAWKTSKYEDRFANRVVELERKGGKGRESEDKGTATGEKVEVA